MPNHPDLAKKLKLLYNLRLNSRIKSHTDLASELGISKQAVSRWLHGSDTRRGDCIPVAQVEQLSTLFQIKYHWFAKSFEQFEKLIFDKLEKQTDPNIPRPDKISISQLPSTSPNVFGRESELAFLNNAWADESTNVVQIVAFGGVGKSCLVNYWLAKLNENNYAGATRIYAWSFYWQGASSDIKSTGDFFIEHALEWFGDEDSSKGTPWAKANRLAKLIRQSRTILILDGLEPLQSPPGPNAGQVENPAISFLIKELALEMNGLCVITTRLPIAELETFREPKLKSLLLGELAGESAIELLKNLGVNGGRNEILTAVKKYSGHPLSLTLLAGYLTVVYQGDIQKFQELHSLFDELSHGGHAKKIMRAYVSWFETRPEQELLFLLSLVDRTTTLSEVHSIVNSAAVDGLTNELQKLSRAGWGYVVKNLSDSQLISLGKVGADLTVDVHPIVRNFFCDYLCREDFQRWSEGHNLIFNYLRGLPISSSLNMQNLEPLFRAVIHGAKACRYNEAFNLYFMQIKQFQFSLFTSGSHYADQACIKPFFELEWTQPVAQLDIEAKYYLLSCAATNLIYLGKINEAIEPARKSIEWFISNEKWMEAASAAAPLASMLIAAGRLREAGELLDAMDDCVLKTCNSIVIASAKNFRAYVKYLSGDIEDAKVLFEESDRYIDCLLPDSPVQFPTVSAYYCKFLLETKETRRALERLLKTFGWRLRKSWQVAIDTTSLYASDLLNLGLTFLAIGDLINAKKYLDQQVEIFRSSDEWLYLPTGLHSRASYFIKVGDYDAAITDLNEALQISQRTGALFGEWESYLNLARLCRARNQADQCAEYLQKAMRLPNMHMYRFRDGEIAELRKFVTSGAN